MALLPGTILSNRFRILNEQARGGMSVVYLAMDIKLNSTKAIKEIKRVEDASNTMGMIHYKALLAEADLLKGLDHPHLPRIFDVIETETHFYVVMDFIEGMTLSRYLETSKTKRASQDDTIKWGLQIAGVLKYLHDLEPPIIYRDMKPSNVMLQPDGNIKLFDFGISRSVESGASGATTALGSKGYAAPEQGGLTQRFDQRSDIYAFGRSLYHMVTGHSPRVRPELIKPIREWDPSLSSGLESIILRCTEEDPDKRYQTVDDLIYALEHYHELDLEEVRKSKLKLWGIGILATLGIGLMVGGWGVHTTQMREAGVMYDSYIAQGDISRDPSDYLNALEINGTDPAIYEKLIDVYKDDGVFTKEEEHDLKVLLSDNDVTLEKKTGYMDMSYELGKLYWFYYEDGTGNIGHNVNIQGRINAVRWFTVTSEHTDTSIAELSKSYVIVGDFYRNIVAKVEQAEDKGAYAEAFESMSLIIDSSEDLPELMKLENVRISYTMLDMYALQISKDGISYERATDLADASTKLLNSFEATAAKTEEIQKQLRTQSQRIDAKLKQVWKPGERG